jgi:osmotically-inducible protein OsmY
MASLLRPFALSVTAVFVFCGIGCRQEQPGAPPPPPTPKTSAAPSAPSVSTSASAAPAGTPAQSVDNTTSDDVVDAVITGKVRAALLGTEDVKATELNVETRKGVVHLSGSVQTNADLDRAVHLARQVEGVKEVQNRLSVKPS